MAKSNVFEDDMLDLLFENVSKLGVSAKEAAEAFKALGEVLGGVTKEVTLTRPKDKNRDTARIEAKHIHGGHVSVSASGVKTYEVHIDYTDRFILNPFQVGEHVIMSGKGVPNRLHLQIVDRKIQGDLALLTLEDRVDPGRAFKSRPPETEEEGLDIGHELNQ